MSLIRDETGLAYMSGDVLSRDILSRDILWVSSGIDLGYKWDSFGFQVGLIWVISGIDLGFKWD